MKKYCLVPYFFLFWCVADLFLSPPDLILTACAAAILLSVLQSKKRALFLSLAAAAAVGAGIYNVQFLLRSVPVLSLIFAHAEAKDVDDSDPKQRKPRPEGIYTALLLCFAAAIAGLISDIAAFTRLRVLTQPTRLYWALAGVLLFILCLLLFGRPLSGGARKKAASGRRRPHGAVRLVYICACVCAAAAVAGCVLNAGAFGAHNVIFLWMIFLAAVAGAGDGMQSAAGARFGGLLEKLFVVTE